MRILQIIPLATLLLTGIAIPVRAEDCGQFQYQEEAQQLFLRSRQRFANLDPDSNGLACEELPSIATLTDEDPWRLSEPLLLGDKGAELAGYYDAVVLAGDALKVGAFLSFHDLTIKGTPNYTSALRPIWAACTQIRDAGGDRGAQMVCVAVDERGQPLDDRIFDRDYTNSVALEIFNWD